MGSYTDITTQIGDQWAAALKQVGNTVAAVTSGIADTAARLDLPAVELPEFVSQISNAITTTVPQPSEILNANFALTERLLTAQHDLALKLLSVAAPDSTSPAAAPAARPRAAKQ